MTTSDLQTCRSWCAANGVEVVESDPGEWGPKDLPDYFGHSLWWFDSDSEIGVYEQLWGYIRPWLQSVRNLDAVEVEGPYSVKPWKVHDGIQYYAVTSSMSFDYFADMSEQSARSIANILNRECGNGK